MESESSQVRSGNKNEYRNQISYVPIKHELQTETEAQNSIHPFEGSGSELEATIKAENYTGTGSDGDLVASIVKSELVEYQNNSSTENSNKEYDLNINNDPYNGSDSNSDPELDPFAEIDCDPISFSWKPQSNSNPDVSATPIATQINAAHMNHSSNPPSPAAKSVLPISNTSKRDLRRKSTDSKLKCQLCLQTQSSESKLKTHLKICVESHPESFRLRFCVPCNRLYSRSHEYRGHALKTHEIEQAKPGRYPIKCQFCPRTFSLQESLVFHVASHHEINEKTDKTEEDRLNLRPYKCPEECPLSFVTLRGLKSHFQSHKNERQFKCPEPNCEKAFKFNSSLNAHLRRVHSPNKGKTKDFVRKTKDFVRKTFECKEEHCGKKFNFNSNLNAHLQRVHSHKGKTYDLSQKTFKCQEANCGKKFKTNCDLRQHMACHSTEKPFKCPHADCNRMFPNKGRATKHLAVHTGARCYKNITAAERPFKCGQCDRAFVKNWELNTHLRTTHLRVKNERLECPEANCKTTFISKRNLKRHLASLHTNMSLQSHVNVQI